MKNLKMPHTGHNKHLCYLVNMGFHQEKKPSYKKLLNKPRFLCKKCGRIAADSRNLCKPVKL